MFRLIPAVKPIIEKLSTHSYFKEKLATLNETEKSIDFTPCKEDDPRVVKGAYTEIHYLGENVGGATIYYNYQKAQEKAAEFGLGLTMEQLIAHELGHVYYKFAVFQLKSEGSNQQSDALAVAWENRLRAPGPRRSSHNLPN